MKEKQGWNGFSRSDYIDVDVPPELFLARGMLSTGELRSLYFCASKFYQGNGAIVDAGAFAGMSAHGFATGLKYNSNIRLGNSPVIYSYDLFVAEQQYVADYLTNVFYTLRDKDGRAKAIHHQAAIGEDFSHVFWHQNQTNKNLIEQCKGDFHNSKWSAGPIEILFVDVCKGRSLQNHLFAEFLPNLIPNKSILIQQDYNHVWHPHIHLGMEVLAPCFDVLIPTEGGSRYYFCNSLPSEELLRKAIALDFSKHELLEMLERIVERSPDSHKLMMEVAGVRALVVYGYEELARERASRLCARKLEPSGWTVALLDSIVGM